MAVERGEWRRLWQCKGGPRAIGLALAPCLVVGELDVALETAVSNLGIKFWSEKRTRSSTLLYSP